jgi:hypothetical protein
MTSTVPGDVEEAAVDGGGDVPWTGAQAGSIAFPELVRAHFEWERAGEARPEVEARFRRKLDDFQACEGALQYVYWAKRRPSAVALTIRPRGLIASWLTGGDTVNRLHRVTDWLVRERRIADLMHQSDTLAIKVSEVLRGASERIAMQWLYAFQSHLLGFLERTQGRATDRELGEFVTTRRQELLQIEAYYARAGEKAGRIIYFWGMMLGVVVDGSLALVLALILRHTGWFAQPHTRGMETFFICYVAGGLGAIVSVLMRMSSDKFHVDYEIGRPNIRRLGSFRPFIGAVFGIAVYFLIKSGIPRMSLPTNQGEVFFFFAIVAFLAGFNERWTNVLLGQAERTIAASLGGKSGSTGVADPDA